MNYSIFLRRQIKKGTPYYSWVHPFREDGKVKQTALGIGTKPTLDVHLTHRGRENDAIFNLWDQLKKEEVRQELYKRYPDLPKEYKIEISEKEMSRKDAKQLMSKFRDSLALMGRINLEVLSPITLAMLCDGSLRYPNFVRAFNGKVTAIMKRKLMPLKEEITKNVK